MRGKVSEVRKMTMVERITPAYAGKSFPVFIQMSKILGSPPPMRGKAHITHCYMGIFRITPAYAGKRFAALPTA